jgi:hypothetical protein
MGIPSRLRLLAKQRHPFPDRRRVVRELRDRYVDADARPQITQPKFPMLQVVIPFKVRTANQTLDKILGVNNTGVLFSNRK